MTNQVLVIGVIGMAALSGVDANRRRGPGRYSGPCAKRNNRRWSIKEIINWRNPPTGRLGVRNANKCLECVVGAFLESGEPLGTVTDPGQSCGGAISSFKDECGANWTDDRIGKAVAGGLLCPQQWDFGAETVCNGTPGDKTPADWQEFDTLAPGCIACAVQVLPIGTKKANLDIEELTGIDGLPRTNGCTIGNQGKRDACTFADAAGAFGSCGSDVPDWLSKGAGENFPLP